MKTSGLDELEALNLDWNEDQLLMTFSLYVDCRKGEVFSSEDKQKYFDPSKKIEEAIDSDSPFTLRYTYGRLR